MKDLLTIALPVYKRTDFIREALDSAIHQSVPCTVLLIDNNSPHDDFREILDSYNYPHARYIKTDETVPQDENFNNCFRYAETPWVTILHDDDCLHYQFAEHTQKVLEKYKDKVGGITFRSHVSDKMWDGLRTEKGLTEDIKKVNEAFFCFQHLTPFPAVVLKTKKALDMGGFINDLHPIADFDFWYRYSKEEDMLLVNEAMAYYRISPQQSTNHLIDAMINNIYEYRKRLLKENGIDNYLGRLGLEQTRLTNIEFFDKTYESIEMPEEIVNREKMEEAEKTLKNRFIRGLVRRYVNRVSFSEVK